jgi:tRNA pseudouridine-54 N-methylase
VGTGCINSALFLSQGLRSNTQITLCFGGSNDAVEVNGALVRNLRPDDVTAAHRLNTAVNEPLGEEDGVAAAVEDGEDGEGKLVDAAKYSASMKRGFNHAANVSTEDVFRKMLSSEIGSTGGGVLASTQGPPPIVFILDANGEDIEKCCSRLAAAAAAGTHERSTISMSDDGPIQIGERGVVVLLGDDRGLHEEDEVMAERVAKECGAPVMRVSLGRSVLFAIHSIVLVHHYLDKYLHTCKAKAARDMGGRRG